MTGPVAGATLAFTYDGAGRVRTRTNADGYVLTFDYDVADRLTRVTFPDATYQSLVYDRLDVARTRGLDQKG